MCTRLAQNPLCIFVYPSNTHSFCYYFTNSATTFPQLNLQNFCFNFPPTIECLQIQNTCLYCCIQQCKVSSDCRRLLSHVKRFTSLSWTTILPTGSRESWSARRTLLSLWPRRSCSTRLTRWTWYCSYWNRLTGNLVQNRVVARQVTWVGGREKKEIHLVGQQGLDDFLWVMNLVKVRQIK